MFISTVQRGQRLASLFTTSRRKTSGFLCLSRVSRVLLTPSRQSLKACVPLASMRKNTSFRNPALPTVAHLSDWNLGLTRFVNWNFKWDGTDSTHSDCKGSNPINPPIHRDEQRLEKRLDLQYGILC